MEKEKEELNWDKAAITFILTGILFLIHGRMLQGGLERIAEEMRASRLKQTKVEVEKPR